MVAVGIACTELLGQRVVHHAASQPLDNHGKELRWAGAVNYEDCGGTLACCYLADEMDQTPPARSEPLVSGIRTPPVRRNSKLATLGRIFKPWKWRKKKNEKLKQTTSALEKKMAGRQGREELIKQGLLEMMEQDAERKACSPDEGPQPAQSEPATAEQETLTSDDVQPGSPLASGTDQATGDELLSSDAHLDDTAKMPSASSAEEADDGSTLPTADELSQALAGSDSPDSPPRPLERSASQLPSPPLLPTPPPKASCKATKTVTGQAALFQGASMKGNEPALRGQLATPTGSPHLTTVHRPLPPSRVIEELHRALATKHRQDSFQGRECRGSPKKWMDMRLSRTSSMERGKEREEMWSFDGASENKRSASKDSEENKENLMLSSELKDDLLLYQDEEALNDSIISGEEGNGQGRDTCPWRLLNQRPTVDELRDRKILIRFSDYVEVARAQDYDRRADKPWTRLSAADKAAIRKELNEYKSNEMEVHASSKHLTR
ncbi:Phactr3 [Phodopus roborovskii]|uniref:Phactr3 protein n=1 Tax=Phodopus roborovskii TaxID=109678 RepID=A0AAU9YQR1_PHORO|nr:Phactr3 [Phodopus roborovskii]